MTAQHARALAGLLLLAAGQTAAGAAQAPEQIPAREAARRRPSPFNFFIRDPSVRVLADLTRADVAFTTREASHGRVEISTKPYADFPGVVPAGQPPGPSFPPGAVTLSWNNGLGAKTARHDLRMFGLTPRTVYYYVLSASDAAGRTYRYAHQFSTVPTFDVSSDVVPAGKAGRGGIFDSLREAGPAPAAGPPDAKALAARGATLAGEDPLAGDLRKLQVERGRRRGFDIGMAAAEGHTLPGPGKDRLRDTLPPEERPGFDAAVAFSLERNRNADLARRGAAIAKGDPAVAAAQRTDPDPLYRLGFDIGTGFFGDPALGALGLTATGPGSLKVRDALSPAGQRGFNAAVAYHLARDYRR